METAGVNVATLDRARLSDRAASELRRLVVRGELPPGSRLPTEKDLATRLGVTRLTVREALAQLESTGLTHTRHGSGTYVTDFEATGTFILLGDLLRAGRALSVVEVAHLLDFRRIVVLGFLDAIAGGITPERIAAMQVITAAERASLSEPRRLAELDLALNEHFAAVSGNSFFGLLLRSLREAHLQLGEIVFRSADAIQVVVTHEAIVQALEAGDRDRLGRAMTAYLSGGSRLAAQWFARQPRSVPDPESKQGIP